MANKKKRELKIVEQSGYNYKSTPAILLKGKWLEELGFSSGKYVTVTCEEGKLVITPKEQVGFIEVFEAQQLCMVAEEGVYKHE